MTTTHPTTPLQQRPSPPSRNSYPLLYRNPLYIWTLWALTFAAITTIGAIALLQENLSENAKAVLAALFLPLSGGGILLSWRLIVLERRRLGGRDPAGSMPREDGHIAQRAEVELQRMPGAVIR
ncbi:hypothetical protein M409DRAFT_21291 [Zasmidium cellare ATCC 36951]|uniref:Uncharacterized protein n=1 Tax=Zasmidium cellare ATCC 36951 TaxID=1080233 RepID=A0A6A6CNC2_ZASCE|nr:uncharacterized protein M409DRAFT_21291 [Zasmidium cellare ATCC 36951]KAF2168541.1 hypothetical protein M409DRAFT_21291 [Zasmidium cellare ATCC 36951]